MDTVHIGFTNMVSDLVGPRKKKMTPRNWGVTTYISILVLVINALHITNNVSNFICILGRGHMQGICSIVLFLPRKLVLV